MSISIKDIARVAGVAPSTASRALRDHPRISLATKIRIRQLAEEMGYTPSMPARSLVTRDTATIGLVVTSVSDPFLERLVMSIEEIAQKQGYSVILSSSYSDRKRELEVVRSFHERRASGITVVGSRVDSDYLQLRNRFSIPITLTNCRTYPYSVSTDNLSGAWRAVEHLIQLGHRRIAYVAGRQGHRTNLDRLAGYCQALKAIGIHPDNRLILESDGTLQSGFEAAQRLLAYPERPTAIFCFNDMTAIGVLEALHQAKVQVPAEMSVVGFDDIEFACYSCPPLTTVRQRTRQMGRRVMNMLLKLIRGQDDVAPETLPAELIIRATTGPI